MWKYRRLLGKSLNIDTPKTYNEKLQWLKLYDKRPVYTQISDKYEVRKYIDETIGSEYLVPLLGVWDNFEDIDFDSLPNKFVLKCTHDSGGVIICKNKNDLDIKSAKEKLEKSLKVNYYYHGREWSYKNVRPRIICEQYMGDGINTSLIDYKFFCFDGDPKAMFIATDRGVDTRFDFYDMEFNHIPVKQHYNNSSKEIAKPQNFDVMASLASKLSKGVPHVRVDFYEIQGKVFVGELTLYHFSGFKAFEPEEYDYTFGEWLNLPKKSS